MINRAGASHRMFWPPDDLAIAEASVDGEFDTEGDTIAAVGLGNIILAPLPRRTA